MRVQLGAGRGWAGWFLPVHMVHLQLQNEPGELVDGSSNATHNHQVRAGCHETYMAYYIQVNHRRNSSVIYTQAGVTPLIGRVPYPTRFTTCMFQLSCALRRGW